MFIDTVLTRTTDRNPSHPVQLFLWRALFPKYPCPYMRCSCSRRDMDLTRPRARCSSATSLRLAHLDLPSFLYVSPRVQMSRRPLCSVAHGIPVRCPHCLNLAEVLMKRIKVGVPCVHGDSVPDRDPATVQQAFAAAFGRAAFSDRGTGWETRVPAQAPV